MLPCHMLVITLYSVRSHDIEQGLKFCTFSMHICKCIISSHSRFLCACSLLASYASRFGQRQIHNWTGFSHGDGQGHANLFKVVKHYLPGPVSMLSGSLE
ncbi:hypothetical protein S245_000431 [Arachis hypogaea]|nr:uncharacterized protein DS421_1g04450 [Arachis hypogaea]